MSTSIEDIGATAFNFLSLKVKAIILGIIIGLFFLIIIPVLLIAGLFTTDNNEDTEETTTSSVVSGEVISDPKPCLSHVMGYPGIAMVWEMGTDYAM